MAKKLKNIKFTVTDKTLTHIPYSNVSPIGVISRNDSIENAKWYDTIEEFRKDFSELAKGIEDNSNNLEMDDTSIDEFTFLDKLTLAAFANTVEFGQEVIITDTLLKQTHKGFFVNMYNNLTSNKTFVTLTDKKGLFVDLCVDSAFSFFEITKSIEDRFVDAMNKLHELGVFYKNNYSGAYHERFPHETSVFIVRLDRHRGGFDSYIEMDSEDEVYLCEVQAESPTVEFVLLLERSIEKIEKIINGNE